MSIACGITKCSDKFQIEIYDINTQTTNQPWCSDTSIHEIIGELITEYKSSIGVIVVANDPRLEIYELEDFKKYDFEKYDNLVYIATREEMDFKYYLAFKIDYSIEDLIIVFKKGGAVLNQCIGSTKGRQTWKVLDEREYEFTDQVDFKYVERMFHLKMNQVHAVFEEEEEEVHLSYGFELYDHNFKSTNFVQYESSNPLIISRFLMCDPQVPIAVNVEELEKRNDSQNFTIRDWGFIHVPKLVKKYEPRIDIMGIDLGSTRCVLAVSRNREIQVVPFDNSSEGDLWTESIVSFDEEKPLFGKAAIKRLKTKPDYVIFDAKLLFSPYHRWVKSGPSGWPFKFNVDSHMQSRVELATSKGLKEFSLAEINAIFLRQMEEAANKYQKDLNNENSVRKTVITVPRYFLKDNIPSPMVSSVIEAAKLANLEIIDIIEETHADLLYYLSKEKYSEIIKPGMKIAIVDIGGGTGIYRIYEISQYNNVIYATCFRDSGVFGDDDAMYSGRNLDDMIVKELRKSIPEGFIDNLNMKTVEILNKIKHDLSLEEKTELDLSEIDSRLEGVVEFTGEWFKKKLDTHFNNCGFSYITFKQYPLPTQSELRCRRENELEVMHPPLYEVDIVFVAGGTCRIPFIQKRIEEQFPRAEVIVDGPFEIITATGAAIHALQVLSGEVEPYIKIC